jgi:hypothetical protein
MVTLFFSVRRDGRSLGQMARDELGPIGGVAALVGRGAPELPIAPVGPRRDIPPPAPDSQAVRAVRRPLRRGFKPARPFG